MGNHNTGLRILVSQSALSASIQSRILKMRMITDEGLFRHLQDDTATDLLSSHRVEATHTLAKTTMTICLTEIGMMESPCLELFRHHDTSGLLAEPVGAMKVIWTRPRGVSVASELGAIDVIAEAMNLETVEVAVSRLQTAAGIVRQIGGTEVIVSIATASIRGYHLVAPSPQRQVLGGRILQEDTVLSEITLPVHATELILPAGSNTSGIATTRAPIVDES